MRDRMLAHCVLLVLPLLAGAAAPAELAPWADPPGAETPEMAKLIDEAAAHMKDAAELGATLVDPRFMAAHPYPRFRDAVKRHAPVGRLTYAAAPEPGEPVTIRMHLEDADGRPATGVLVYLYQTSARGGYAADAAHVRANSGDTRHARLFGYVVSDSSGTIVVRTIRPGGYPRSDLPQHVHIFFERDGHAAGGTELLFADDPRLTAAMRERSGGEGAIVGSPKQVADGWEVEVTHRL
jgi:protocatechuate 3,4-dioxygenase beta subunit